jgi:hypothetical protein
VFLEVGKQQQWKSTPFTTSEIILNADEYDNDLGMRRNEDIFRQLQIDVPRSSVTVDGEFVTDANIVYRKSPFPRMSTQAVFAPILEWLMTNNVMVSEHSFYKSFILKIDTNERTMSITKKFRFLSTNALYICDTTISIYVHLPSNMLVICNCPYW